jgi:hypothetical protein
MIGKTNSYGSRIPSKPRENPLWKHPCMSGFLYQRGRQVCSALTGATCHRRCTSSQPSNAEEKQPVMQRTHGGSGARHSGQRALDESQGSDIERNGTGRMSTQDAQYIGASHCVHAYEPMQRVWPEWKHGSTRTSSPSCTSLKHT